MLVMGWLQLPEFLAEVYTSNVLCTTFFPVFYQVFSFLDFKTKENTWNDVCRGRKVERFTQHIWQANEIQILGYISTSIYSKSYNMSLVLSIVCKATISSFLDTLDMQIKSPSMWIYRRRTTAMFQSLSSSRISPLCLMFGFMIPATI